ncbi:hypothetical protein BGZ49_002233 [Haplosporangium sp. Z 27]|nr:hypothetical protein BGZ49_002233 [Haplosporangium sp. Z 27]
MAAPSNLHQYGNYNDVESVDMDSVPSLSYSTMSSASDMEFDQVHVNAYEQQQRINLQRQNENAQQQQVQQQVQQQQYQQYQQHQDQLYPQNVLNVEKQIHFVVPVTESCLETGMPSLTNGHSTDSSKILKSADTSQRPVYPVAIAQPVGKAMPDGLDLDLEYFTTSVLNLIPSSITDNVSPALAYFDYSKEFPTRKIIAKGGNGEIRQAFWAAKNCDVILKSLFSFKHSPTKVAILFDKEVEVLRLCGNHDNIVQFYGIAIRDQVERFMVMHYYERGDLVKLLETPQYLPDAPTFNDKLFLALDMAMGLDHLFQCGFHHGDLHPKNILIDIRPTTAPFGFSRGRYQARLTDFGLRRIRDNTNAYSSQQLGGVFYFMAPERMFKNRPRYNVQCDIFALGVIYWYLTSARYPFKETPTYNPGDRETRVEGTPDWFHSLYTQAWSEDPNDRQQSLDEIIQVLREHLGLPVSSSMGHIDHSQVHHIYQPSTSRPEDYRPSGTSFNRAQAQQAYPYGTNIPSRDNYGRADHVDATSNLYDFNMPSPTPAVPKQTTKSGNPNHPRNKKQIIPNGMAGRINYRS